MSLRRGPSIVTDGLVFYVDAANTKSYVSGSTTTNSLVGNITGSLINDTDFSTENQGTWVFDGTDDYIKSNYTGTIPSISLWFKSNSTITTTSSGSALIGFEDGAPNYGGIYLGAVTGLFSNELITIFSTSTFNKSYYSQVGGTIDTNWHNLTISYTGTQYNIYLDSVNVWSGNSGGDVSIINATRFDIGTRILSNNISDPFKGKISNIQVYNRALLPEEVQQNYNALKGRFGL